MTNAVKKQTQSSVIEEREVLLSALTEGNVLLAAAAEELYANLPVSHAEAEQYCNKVIVAVDAILAAGDWKTSLFLRNLIKPIIKIGEDAQDYLGGEIAEQSKVINKLDTVGEDQQLLYVSLFQAQGHDVKSWEKQVRALNRYIVGRPIYAEEDNVKKVIRLKQNSANEAYVVLAVDKKFIQKPNAFEVERKDRYGNSLETLKPGVITDANIFELVHDDQRYSYERGHLIKA